MRQSLRQGCFSNPWNVLDQKVAFRQKADQRQLDGLRLPADNLFYCGLQLMDCGFHFY
jgi:hypothetical protein